MTKQLLKGNIAFAEAAVRYGLQAYFGYPITPQSEALEHLSARRRKWLEPNKIALEKGVELASDNGGTAVSATQ